MILGARLEAEGYAKFLFSLSQLLSIHERGAEIVVGQAGFGIERQRLCAAPPRLPDLFP